MWYWRSRGLSPFELALIAIIAAILFALAEKGCGEQIQSYVPLGILPEDYVQNPADAQFRGAQALYSMTWAESMKMRSDWIQAARARGDTYFVDGLELMVKQLQQQYSKPMHRRVLLEKMLITGELDLDDPRLYYHAATPDQRYWYQHYRPPVKK